MTPKTKILVLGAEGKDPKELVEELQAGYEPVVATNPAGGLDLLRQQPIAGVYVGADQADGILEASLFPWTAILEALPDGLAVVDSELRITWSNSQFVRFCGHAATTGQHFYEALGSPEILGPDYCPMHTALNSGVMTTSTLRCNHRYFQVQAVPLRNVRQPLLLIVLRDVTTQIGQQQKLDAIHQAGFELANLTPEELAEMEAQGRIELLKSNIVRHTKDLLQFDTVEIRLLDRQTGKLEPLLAVGMSPQAAERELYARSEGNGVTGFVAATGKSYLCEDTGHDPLYLPGAPGARSSLTVPLLWHDEVIGTFNVESPEPGAFTESDLKFLEIFSRNVAAALNTLELLVAEKMTTATASVDAIHREVALPADEILIDTSWVLERYIGHVPEAAQRLAKILENTRQIKQLIQKVGEQLTPVVAHPPLPPRPVRPLLRGRRVLVVDNDDAVRQAAHALLERYGCIVETAHDGQEALLMARSGHYDAILADIRLPDMTGYDCFCKLRDMPSEVPVILMTGFGYDPTHSIVSARRAGLKHVLYKPFRVDQLLQALEDALSNPLPEPVSQSAGPSTDS